MERPVVVTGAAGQLGSAVFDAFSSEWTTIGLTRRDLDLSQAHAVRERLAALQPWAIVNCAGYNQVDAAEDDAIAAMTANAFAVLTLARVAASLGAVFVHYSSDFVFDGEATRPYEEEDRPSPQSVYAASKMLGDWFAAESPDHYILRVESLFGGPGPNKSSLDRIVEAIAAGRTVRVFTDRIVSPSYACDVAQATRHVLRVRPAVGLYHCVNGGAATWHEVGLELKRQLGSSAELAPVKLADVALRARRPRYCALANDKLRRAAFAMPPWQDAVARSLRAGKRASH